MNEEKKRLIITSSIGAVIAIGIGVLIYFQREKIAEQRIEVENLKVAVAQDRALIKTTPELVKEVIVQRETDAVIEEILSSEKDINDLVRTLEAFGDEAGVNITQFKERRAKAKKGRRQDFENVGYTLNFEGDAFQLLAFLDHIETHRRFMSVTAFKLSAASRNEYESDAGPQHRVQLDLETYVYTPTGVAEEVRIDQYDRKRDLLISEISKRAADLRFVPYEYRGGRGRRDPWIDPRVDVEEGGGNQMTIEGQLELVAELVDRAHRAEAVFNDAETADNVVAEMKALAELDELLAVLDADILEVEDTNVLTYVLAAKRFENRVVDVVARLRVDNANVDLSQGPSLALLKQTADTMESHVRNQEWDLAIDVFNSIESRLEGAKGEERVVLAQTIHQLKLLCDTVLEFETIALDIRGIAVHEDFRPVALINGESVTEGELVGDELIIRSIMPDQVEFAFRGLVLARLVTESTNTP